MYRCEQNECGATLSRAWNLKRHNVQMHQLSITTFVNTTVSIAKDSTWSSAAGSNATPPILEVSDKLSEGLVSRNLDLSARHDHSLSNEITGTSILESLKDAQNLSYTLWMKDNISKSSTMNSLRTGHSTNTQSRVNRKRKRSFHIDRILRARLSSLMSKYEVKQSKIKSEQQRVIDWLNRAAKQKFEQVFETLVERWGGVKSTHQGTCVLCSKDWRSLSSISLLNIVDSNQFSARQSSRLIFQYSNHVITFARSATWFRSDSWSRTGVSLDNFLECDLFKPMEVSHLCHQEHCLVHIFYETADVNQDRKTCAMWARTERQEGRDISKSCLKHDPPCLLQVCLENLKIFHCWHNLSMSLWSSRKYI